MSSIALVPFREIPDSDTQQKRTQRKNDDSQKCLEHATQLSELRHSCQVPLVEQYNGTAGRGGAHGTVVGVTPRRVLLCAPFVLTVAESRCRTAAKVAESWISESGCRTTVLHPLNRHRVGASHTLLHPVRNLGINY